jgi:thioredoxin reductase (NADPH)
MNEVRKVIIIGGGPAGFSAAIYLSRANLAPLMINNQTCQLTLTSEVENFPGFKEGVSGSELMLSMRGQAEKFGTEILEKEVTGVDFSGEIKKIYVGEEEYLARAVVIATGARPKVLKVGEKEFIGRGVSTCAVCDAAFFREKTVYVVGGGDSAVEEVLYLAKYTNKVSLIHRRSELRASKIMQDRLLLEKKLPVLWNREVVGVSGSGKLEKIRVRNVQTGEEEDLMADGLFLALGHEPATGVFVGKLELDDHGFLVIGMTSGGVKNNREMWISGYPTQTSVTGVFGAGDVCDIRYRQAITAAGMGAMAALDVEKFLTGSLSSY